MPYYRDEIRNQIDRRYGIGDCGSEQKTRSPWNAGMFRRQPVNFNFCFQLLEHSFKFTL